jgi:hypothetical protein
MRPAAITWDLCLARRASAVGGLAAVLTLVIVATTDAGGTLVSRLGMTAALAPLAGALGALVALRGAESSGEVRALAAIGVDPWRAARGAVLGGVAVGGVGVLVVASGLGDLGVLFPRLATRSWFTEGDGVRELSLGLHVAPGGLLSIETRRVAVAVAASMLPRNTLALATLAVAAVAAPAWIAAPTCSLTRRLAVGAAAMSSAIVAFQAVAAGRLTPVALVAPPLLLLGDALVARYRGGLDE